MREREYQSEDWMESTNNVNSLLVEYRYKRGAVWKEFPDGRQELFRKVRGGNDGTGILFIFFGFAFLKLLEMYLNRKKQPPRETAAPGPEDIPQRRNGLGKNAGMTKRCKGCFGVFFWLWF